MMCVIDCETTGLIPGTHDIIEVAVVALTPAFTPNKDVMPFHIMIHPKRWEKADPKALEINKLDYDEIMTKGFDPYKAADLFDQWYKNLGCEKILPLAQNWPFDRGFLIDWLGMETFNQLIDYHYRDTTSIAHYLNDRALYNKQPPPFAGGVSLKRLCHSLKIERERSHTALDDALATSYVYSKMVIDLLPAF